MDVSDLRKRILRALDEARKEANERRVVIDTAAAAYATFLENIATPLMRQTSQVLRAEGHPFSIHTPADSVRLASDHAPQAYIEFVLDRTGALPKVLGRASVPRGRENLIIEEEAIGDGKAVAAVTEDDVTGFLLATIPKLVLKI